MTFKEAQRRIAAKDARYARHWGITEKPRGPCVSLGVETGERKACETCSGGTKIKVCACAVHALCTIGKQVADMACCADCNEFQSKERLNNG